jgi:hypothetical protein
LTVVAASVIGVGFVCRGLWAAGFCVRGGGGLQVLLCAHGGRGGAAALRRNPAAGGSSGRGATAREAMHQSVNAA